MIYDGPKRERDEIEGVLPPEFARQVFGHITVRQRLQQQLDQDRLPGGILLHGPRGIGKATLAFDLAKRILVKTGDEPTNRVETQVKQGAHPNVSTLRIDQDNGKFKTAISVESVRNLIDTLHQTRGRAGHRIAILDAAEDCNRNAMNALLKILEEPPSQCHFLLVSHQPGRLLPTIKSRCQAHSLRALSKQEISDLAAGIELEADEDALDPGTIALANGNPRTLHELRAMGDTNDLSAVTAFLSAPLEASVDAVPPLAQTLASKQNVAVERIARSQLLTWIGDEAKSAAVAGIQGRLRLASAGALWDKANQLFTQTDTYNLDLAATYLILFDAIKQQARLAQEQQI